jgi:AcrR family transcriptional regulator
MFLVARAQTHKTKAKSDAPRRTRLDVDARRAQLVALGLEHFGDRSYDEVSLEDIARAAGISKGLVYHYFPTKKHYFVATVREAADRLVTRALADQDGPPPLRLLRGLDAYLDYVRAHARAYVTLMRSGGVDPELATIVDETRQLFLEHMTSGLRDAPEPEIARQRDAPLVRLALRGWCGMVETMSVEWVAGGCQTPQAQVRDVLVASLVEVLRAAIAPAVAP